MSWTREEIEQAYQDYQAKVRDITASGDWAPFADLFTEDAVYIEHLFGRFEGREAIRAWITKTMSRFPGNLMTGFPHEWYVIDEEAGRVVCHIWNDMPDPGDGKRYSAYNITVLMYAGDGLWSSEEDIYNPAAFDVMIKDWTKAKERSGAG
jgi:ketosteroid isomerase-like protein